jgi:hypothetical protein
MLMMFAEYDILVSNVKIDTVSGWLSVGAVVEKKQTLDRLSIY